MSWSWLPWHVCNDSGQIAVQLMTGKLAPECCRKMHAEMCREIAEEQHRYMEERFKQAMRRRYIKPYMRDARDTKVRFAHALLDDLIRQALR